jgi:hypothetical protein
MSKQTVSAAGGAMPASSRQTARKPRRIKLAIENPAPLPIPVPTVAPLPRTHVGTDLNPSQVVAMSLALGLVTFILGGIA